MSDRLQSLASGRSESKAKGFAAWTAGRGRRREYWAIVASVLAVVIVLAAFGLTAVATIASFGVTLAFIRRLHDLGWSGWLAPVINIGLNVLSGLLGWLAADSAGPGIAGVLYLGVIVILGAIPGEPRENEYGPIPGRPKDTELAKTFS